jgi:PBP1b-binding outer membrane lipoprotein LpoB
MKIVKTLTVLAVVTLLLNGCSCADKLTGKKGDTETIPTPTPTSNPKNK